MRRQPEGPQIQIVALDQEGNALSTEEAAPVPSAAAYGWNAGTVWLSSVLLTVIGTVLLMAPYLFPDALAVQSIHLEQGVMGLRPWPEVVTGACPSFLFAGLALAAAALFVPLVRPRTPGIAEVPAKPHSSE